jgi:hypothetical protein
MASTSSLVKTSTHDYLDQDPELRGQKYACMSFVSPEEVIKRKDVYVLMKFTKALSQDVLGMFSNIEEKFKGTPQEREIGDMIKGIQERYSYLYSADEMQKELESFGAKHQESINRDFGALENFQTSIRGFKVRGVYDSLDEARARASKIMTFDKKFNVFVSEVGCWCAWSPNPDEINDQEYAESHLNTLMKHEFYEKRKGEFIAQAASRPKVTDEGLQDNDPWVSSKINATSEVDENRDTTTETNRDTTTETTTETNRDTTTETTTETTRDTTTETTRDSEQVLLGHDATGSYAVPI